MPNLRPLRAIVSRKTHLEIRIDELFSSLLGQLREEEPISLRRYGRCDDPPYILLHIACVSRLDKLDQDAGKDRRDNYEEDLKELQGTLFRIHRHYHLQKKRAVLVFEGSDAAGKGGSIRRLTEKLDPRSVRVHAIGAPNPEEQARHYMARFWRRLPVPGRICIFDRSWYGRVLVERVEGFASKDEWKRAYDEIREFERQLVEDGVVVLKLFLHITKEEQLERFEKRLSDPYKRWKLTREDIRNRGKWDEYVEAIEDMLEKTDFDFAPWEVVPANHKRAARLTVLEEVTKKLGKGIDIDEPIYDRDFLKEAEAWISAENKKS